MATKKEIIKQKLAQADFTDDVMFGLIMAKQAIYKRFLETVLPKKVFEDIRAITQRQLKTDYISREGRLDLLCTTKSGEQFNIELQMTNEHNLPHYHALLANHVLAVGEDYPNLKDSYVIFLCNFDVDSVSKIQKIIAITWYYSQLC